MSDAVSRYRERFDAEAESLPGAGTVWLDRARREALERFERRGFPSPREEDWKYTRVAPIEKHVFEFEAPAIDTPDPGPWLLPAETEVCAQLVFVDGVFRADLSRGLDGGGPGAGIRVGTLAELLRERPQALSRWMDRPGESHAHAFTALNTAFARDGVLVEVDENGGSEAALHLLFLSSGTADTIANPRIVLTCARGARLTVVESYAAMDDASYFNNVVTEATLAEGAALTHYKLQRESNRAFHVSTLRVQQEAESAFTSHSISLGAALARHEIDVQLDGVGASCVLNGLYIGRGRQHVDYHTRIDHSKPGCTSVEDYKGILSGRARGVFNGRVYVHPGAQQTDASQSNKNLLLSREAEIDTKPQLEIYADDVKCAHGATVGQLDEAMIFYLRSRGIDEDAARSLLTYGFARDIVDRIAIASLREAVAESLLERLPRSDELRDMLS